MPQNTDSNINLDETGATGLVLESDNFLNEPPDPPGQNDTRTAEIDQLGSEMNPEAQVISGDTTTTTTTTTTAIDNRDEHAKDRHAKRKATDVPEEVETELIELRQEIRADENQINEVRGRLKIDENMIQKIFNELRISKQSQEKLAKENAKLAEELTKMSRELTEVKKERAELASMVDYLTLKANEHDEKLRSFEHSKQDRQSWAQVASLTKKLENVEKRQKVLVTSGKQHNRAILMNMDQNKSVQRQLNSVKKTVNESNYPSAPVAPRAFAKSPVITISPSERTEAMKQENKTDREIKKIIDKEIAPSMVVGVNFTGNGNLTLHIKDMNNETMEKLKPFGNAIDNETWHKVIIDGLMKNDLIEDGDLIDADELKAEIENRNNIELACSPHAIKTEALKGDKTTRFSLVVAVKNEHHSKEMLKKGIFLINQHCYARQWLPPKPRKASTKPNELNRLTDTMEVDNNELSQSNSNNDQ
ncbi:hypothetical protein D0Z00_000110 [Geotrichum galactomycetum]|uniref:Uncharacterized protein n=2 Tax=Geotrichum galactomycetum TaxID=27317 RepID=A0ACB6VAX8_9ASCO|nr:hypothetical protein D0Z00_000306 [Geotrichum candidum]KAF5103132.1 hypothetical protein D0Z00_000110 [Geotrichum candidum]